MNDLKCLIYEIIEESGEKGLKFSDIVSEVLKRDYVDDKNLIKEIYGMIMDFVTIGTISKHENEDFTRTYCLGKGQFSKHKFEV